MKQLYQNWNNISKIEIFGIESNICKSEIYTKIPLLASYSVNTNRAKVPICFF